MLVDSHCHLDQLDLSAYHGDLSLTLKAAADQHIDYILCVCIDLNNYPRVLDIAQTYQNIGASFGLHPNEKIPHEPDLKTLIQLASPADVVAIGETGLDYYRLEDTGDWQRERFRRHIRAARELSKPLIIHSRLAQDDTLKILREERAHEVGGVLHCFTESLSMAQQAIDLNFYISFSGIITFKNAVELQATASQLPRTRLLIETDAPYLAPVPFRGKPNEPKFVYYVAQHLAQLQQCSVDEIAATTTKNFFELFKLACYQDGGHFTPK